MSNLYTPTFSESLAVAQTRGADSDAPHQWDGLVADWSFLQGGGGELFDTSGYGNHGTLTNMDPATDWVTTGQRGIPWALDIQAGEYIAVSGLPAMTTWTATIWCNLSVLGSQALLGTGADFNNRFRQDTAAGRQYVYSSDGSIALTDWGDAADMYGWRLWSYRFDGTTLRLGRDVEFADSGGMSGKTFDWTAIARLGQDNGNTMDGPLGNVMIHSRWLADSEIQQLHEDPMAMFRRRPVTLPAAVAAAGAVMNQLQGSNLGADLYNGTMIA